MARARPARPSAPARSAGWDRDPEVGTREWCDGGPCRASPPSPTPPTPAIIPAQHHMTAGTTGVDQRARPLIGMAVVVPRRCSRRWRRPLDDPALVVALMLALRGMKIAQSVAC
jgi:hypothetical protein